MREETVTIHPRFCGPPRSGNGGYVCGITARHLSGACAVRLRAPPPLATELTLRHNSESAVLSDRTIAIAEARQTRLDLDVPPAPDLAAATRASADFLGYRQHPFPGCFVCGTEREHHDGMCVYPGPLPDSNLIAAPWTPDDSLADGSGRLLPEFLWAALDCPGAFVLMPLPDGKGIVLGELVAEITGAARSGDTLIACAWPIDVDGRKHFAGTAIFSTDGELVARAKATWIEIPLAHWQ